MIKASLKIVLDEEFKDLCGAILKALIPDDKTPPKGFTINSYCRENTLVYEISSSNMQLLTLSSIIDEVSRLCEMIGKTIRYLKT